MYPDGIEMEQTSLYDVVALDNFAAFVNMSHLAGVPPPAAYSTAVEQMYNYIAYVVDPTGHPPLNGDADNNTLTSLILDASAWFKRPDWQYIATRGQSGTRPQVELKA